MKKAGVKIHLICLVKNEADIVAYSLRQAKQWADFIYVYDNGSSDETWDIVEGLADDQVIPFRSDGRLFNEGLRQEVFQAYREKSNPGDWWGRLDADEIHYSNIREQLLSTPERDSVVWGAGVNFYITEKDLGTISKNGDVESRLTALKYYNIPHAEIRFFRYRDTLEWYSGEPWPRHMGSACSNLIYYKHYKYRNIEQAKRRVLVRNQAIKDGFDTPEHYWNRDSWEPSRSSELNYTDDPDRIDFAKVGIQSHIEPGYRRLLKRLLIRTGIWK